MEGRSGNVKKIVIATKNQGKIREMLHAFAGLDVELVSLAAFGPLPDAIEDGDTFADNARIKAAFYREQTGCACLADDSGLSVAALDGAPGVYSARFAGDHADDDANNARLLAELAKKGAASSDAAYHCVLAFCDLDGTVLTACTWEAQNLHCFPLDTLNSPEGMQCVLKKIMNCHEVPYSLITKMPRHIHNLSVHGLGADFIIF